jgi:hypothetical protein
LAHRREYVIQSHVQRLCPVVQPHNQSFITRGAMMVCTNNQCGVDIVLPLCLKEGNLSRHTVSAILIQVKNAQMYGSHIHQVLFDAMAPVKVGLFDEKSTPKPIIRMVFALASKECGVYFQKMRQRRMHPDTFTSFDIWCAGVSRNTFDSIGEDDLTPYQVLLDHSLRPHDAFDLRELQDTHLDPITKDFRGSQRRRMLPLMMPHPPPPALLCDEDEGGGQGQIGGRAITEYHI